MGEKNYFQELNSIDCSGKTEKKNGLTYLSWAWAWGELKKKYPDATYKVYETESGCIYFTDGNTCWVKTSVTVNNLEHTEYLPVMDFRNRSIPLDQVTSFDVNKTIQRSLTKAVARHGLGLYIYAGEDLPEEAPETISKKPKSKLKSEQLASEDEKKNFMNGCKILGINAIEILTSVGWTDGPATASQIAEATVKINKIAQEAETNESN